jgi:hypothetical protein
MIRAIVVMTMSFGVVGAAWGQSQEDIAAAAGKQLNAFANCINATAQERANDLTVSAEVVADRALGSCMAERRALWEQIQKPPLSMAPDTAAREITKALGDLRPKVIQTVEAARS